MAKEETLEAIIAGAKANGSWDKKYPDDDKKAQPVQEPVAWSWVPSEDWGSYFTEDASKAAVMRERGLEVRPLYTAPFQRPWVGLTYEDMVKLQKDLYDAKGESVLPTTFAMAVEARLRSKNA